MIKKVLFFTILLGTCFVSAQRNNSSLEFIGYDGLLPVFASTIDDNGRPLFIHDSIYKYVNGRLINMNIPLQEESQCISVKNGIYVFSDTLNGLTRFQFKRNGKELISQITLNVKEKTYVRDAVMNDEYFFVRGGCHNGKDIILRTTYPASTKKDTIKIGFCTSGLLDATNDYLYFTESIGDFSDGHVYQVNIKDGKVKMIAEDIDCEVFGFAVAPHLNLIFSGNYGRPILIEYNKKQSIQSQDRVSYGGIFFSYERNAFVNYKSTLDISKWECFYLGEGGKLPTELRGVPCFVKK